jgi:hypothetical protein
MIKLMILTCDGPQLKKPPNKILNSALVFMGESIVSGGVHKAVQAVEPADMPTTAQSA